MGVFLQTALFPGCEESAARAAVETAAKNPAFQIDLKTCRYAQNFEGTQVLMEGDCLGFATLAKALAGLSGIPVCLRPARIPSAPLAREKNSAYPAIRRRCQAGFPPGTWR